MTSDAGLFVAYGVLLLGAVIPIHIGSHVSLRTPKVTRDLRNKLRNETDDEEEDEDDDEVHVGEQVTSTDAWLFPVFGSVVLCSMYLVFRYLDKKYVNMLLSLYFGVLGLFSLTKGLRGTIHAVLGKKFVKRLEKYKVQITRAKEDVLRFTFTQLDLLVLLPLALVIDIAYLFTRHWTLSNVLALSLAVNAIALMRIDSFETGSIMLGGLFVYDCFWVFGTDVMVSVARNFDAPIKIVWPKNIIEGITMLLHIASPKSTKQLNWQFTMLGLGDIVIPGIFVALALRYDQHVAATSQKKPSLSFTKTFTAFPKPYFQATFIAYIVGLATTMTVMHVFKAAQPALLYLSPACVSAVAIQASLLGEWKQVWAWKDAEEEEKDQEGTGDKKDKDSSDKVIPRSRKSSAVSKTRVPADQDEDSHEERSAAIPTRTASTRKRRTSTKARS